jgi:hypothetical protein
MREKQYAERREKDWEASLKRESELHRSMKEQVSAVVMEKSGKTSCKEEQRSIGPEACEDA